MKKSTFLRASLAALLLGGTGSLGTQAQDLPTLSTDNETHYYLIQNNRSGKYADKDFNQTTTVSPATVWTFTASNETFENGQPAKIHNMSLDASANALNDFTPTYTSEGITWYVKAEGSTFSISSLTTGLDTEGSGSGYSWNDSGSLGKTIGQYNHSDPGSQWNFVEKTEEELLTAFETALNEMKTQATESIEAVGEHAGDLFYPATDAVNRLQNVLNATTNPTTLAEYVTIYNNLGEALAEVNTSMTLPEAGTYYIVNHKYSRYMTVANKGAGVTASTEKTNNAIWTLTYNTDGTFTLVNAFGYYIGAIPGYDSSQYTSTTDASAAGSFSFVEAGTTYPGYTAMGGTAYRRQMHEDASHKVVNWGTGAEPTYWTFEAVEIPYDEVVNDFISSVEVEQAGDASYVGYFDTGNAAYATAKAAALANPSKETYNALVAAATAAKTVLDPAKLYRIQNYARKSSTLNTNNPGQGGYMEVTDKNITLFTVDMAAIDADDSRATAIWKFEPTADNATTYKLHNLNSGLYVGTSESEGFLQTAADADNAATVSLTDLTSAQWNITPSGKNSLHASGNTEAIGAGIMCYNTGKNEASAWYIIPATTIDLNVGATGYATVNYPFAVELPAGVTAYKVSGETDAAVTLAKLTLTGNVLPAGTPVIVTASEGKYTLTLLPDNTDDAIETGLKGTTVSAYHDAYILSKQEGDEDVKFYRLADDSYVYPNKAYLDATTATGESLALKIGGTTTGISGATATDGAETYYDLNGRRVFYPAKGIFVTESGKKVILK